MGKSDKEQKKNWFASNLKLNGSYFNAKIKD